MKQTFADDAYVRRMVDVEAALARAQSKLGVIPAAIGQEMTEAFANAQIECDANSITSVVEHY